VDTRHTKEESNGQRQNLYFDSDLGYIFLDKESKAGCLGADDGVGIWIMLNMIIEKVPGTYIFHTGEECGGLGAYACLKSRPEWLERFDRAIAFDRPNDYEVITVQGGMKCASDTAGIYLAKELSKHNLSYEVSDRGVFTDTKVYAHIIPECFNIGVGYYSQHSPDEQLDYNHAKNLLDACLVLDWEKIPTVREPKAYLQKPAQSTSQAFNGFSTDKYVKPAISLSLFEELDSYCLEELVDICENTPQEAAKIIIRLNSAYKGLRAELDNVYGQLGVL
jgi:hypothetical protein